MTKKGKTWTQQEHTCDISPPLGWRIPRHNSTTGEGGWAPWRLVQDGDTEEASTVDQADPGAMVDQGTREAMAGQGTWETLADVPPPPQKKNKQHFIGES